jgi:hypothetical protein
MKNTTRILYIDNLRILLISLVVLHHLSITYGATGGWYYREVEGDSFTTLILTMFTASNQSFFMGFFFLVSAYFTRISLERKPVGTFVKDRFFRLVIPLIIFYFILSPLTNFVKARYGNGLDITFFEFVKEYRGFGFGPMWFVETLIYFSIIYVIIRLIFKQRILEASTRPCFPGPIIIILFTLGISAVSFVVRLWFLLGSELGNTGLQLPYFPQYIAMLVIGLLFARFKWFDAITYRQGIKWFMVAQFFIFITFPLLFILGMDESGIEPFIGGWTWQSASLSIWEQIVGISLMIGLTGIFKEKFNNQARIGSLLSGAAYAVFIIHPLVLVSLSLMLKDWEIYPVLKFIIIAPIALFLCFSFGILLKMIPFFNKVI